MVCSRVPVVGETVKLVPEFAEVDEAGRLIVFVLEREAVDGSVAGLVGD